MKSVCFIVDDYLNAGDIALFSGGLWVDRCFSEPVSIKGLGLKVKCDRLQKNLDICRLNTIETLSTDNNKPKEVKYL